MEEVSVMIEEWSQQLKVDLDPHEREDRNVVEKGLLLYRQRMVHSVRAVSQGIVGKVQDVMPVEVHLNSLHVDEPLMECSCPARDFCRHGMALFFYLYSRDGSVSQWMEDWRKSHSKVPLFDKERQFEKQIMATLRDEEEETQAAQAKNTPTELYDSWLAIADAAYDNGLGQKSNLFPYLMNMYGQFALREIGIQPSMNRELVPPYKIVTHVRLLERMLQLFESTRFSVQEIEDTCKQLIHSIVHNVERAIETLPNPVPLSLDPVFERLSKDVRELLFHEGAFKQEVLSIYWMLWNDLFTRSTFREQEANFANATAKKGNPDSSWAIAASFHAFINGNLEDALQRLEQSGPDSFGYVFKFLEYYAEQHKWMSVSAIMPYFKKHIKDYLATMDTTSRRLFIYSTTKLLYEYVVFTQKSDEYEDVLAEMMPYSARNLAEFYFDNSDYAKFMEFVYLSGQEEYLFNRETLKTIQAEEPATLLPYYHREVVEAIEKKNRQSYRLAVRYLKKLRTIYKKLKQEEKWEFYFNQLLQDTKRLRAFQEECQRGKLVHVETETV